MSHLTYYARKSLTLKSENIEIICGDGNTVNINGDPIVTLATIPPSSLTLAPVGASPNANGATYLAGTLTLQPADGTRPGVLTSVAQTIGGDKTFTGQTLLNDVIVNSNGIDLGADGSRIFHDGHSIYQYGASLAGLNYFAGRDSGNNTATGSQNTASGYQSLINLTTGSDIVAMGKTAGHDCTTGGRHVLVGWQAGYGGTTADQCTYVGYRAGVQTTDGSHNTALGYNAGSSWLTNDSDNVAIQHDGVGGDNGVIRIGTGGTHTSCYVAGIDGVAVPGAVAVYVMPDGKLGTVPSSKKYKKDITNIDGIPVLNFRAKKFKLNNDPSGKWMHGFIAEEVAVELPNCVAYEPKKDEEGKVILNDLRQPVYTEDPRTVCYDQLIPFLQDVIRQDHEKLSNLEHRLELLESSK